MIFSVIIGLFILFLLISIPGFFLFQKIKLNTSFVDQMEVFENKTNTQQNSIKITNTSNCERYYYLKRSDMNINKCFSDEDYQKITQLVNQYDSIKNAQRDAESFLNANCNTEDTSGTPECENRAIRYRELSATLTSLKRQIDLLAKSN
ncbi:hypothetical protein C4561_05085 [candidate division WWE3 bacterium]|uniref:Uncharacterized protein n=1 Tax=candidate division WWE3 bacterium TaxID=2053526 RepID=A0A3A4ZAZ6_UNCKA|nr:MAG: hypothetical protein C4561_05085 [candidate division WWE3 bacterium]